jgi:AraC-like DNA-binding protein
MTSAKMADFLAAEFRYWKEQGIACSDVARHLGGDPADLHDTLIPLARLNALYEYTSRTLDDPFMGIRIGRQRCLPDMGMLADLFLRHRDARHLLETMIRFLPVVSGFFTATLQEEGKKTQVTLHPLGKEYVHPLIVDACLSGCLRLGGMAINLQSAQHHVRVHIARSLSPAQQAAYSREFGFPVRGNADNNAISFSTDLLFFTNTAHDPVLHTSAVGRAERFCHHVENRQLAGQVLTLIRHHFIDHPPGLDLIAAQLDTSVRRLQRMLHASNLNFRQLMDEVRHEKACHLLASSDSSITEIARQLCYEETASFYKAFKRWSGCSPGEYRRQCLAAEEAG